MARVIVLLSSVSITQARLGSPTHSFLVVYGFTTGERKRKNIYIDIKEKTKQYVPLYWYFFHSIYSFIFNFASVIPYFSACTALSITRKSQWLFKNLRQTSVPHSGHQRVASTFSMFISSNFQFRNRSHIEGQIINYYKNPKQHWNKLRII